MEEDEKEMKGVNWWPVKDDQVEKEESRERVCHCHGRTTRRLWPIKLMTRSFADRKSASILAKIIT